MRRLLIVAMVGLLVATGSNWPGQAAEPSVGGGTLTGRVTFGTNGTLPVPPVNTPCRQVGFTFDAFATIAIRNLGGSFFVGTAGNAQAGTGLTGSGTSECENFTVGGGRLALDAISVTNPQTTGTLVCHGLQGAGTPLLGSYTRTLTDLTAVVGGQCGINHGLTGNVAIVIRAQLVPDDKVGDGVTAGVASARMAAAFTVVPAGDPTG